jgi:hypothetical protein
MRVFGIVALAALLAPADAGAQRTPWGTPISRVCGPTRLLELGANVPEDRTFDERCITAGGVFFPNPFYNNYHQVFQAPGYAVYEVACHEGNYGLANILSAARHEEAERKK